MPGTEITTAFVQQYKGNVEHLLQQKGSVLRDYVKVEQVYGKGAKLMEQVGAVVAQVRTTRHGDTPLIETPQAARWAHPVDYEWADLIDDQDKIRMLIDPESPFAINGAYALGRAMDDAIITAINGTAKSGADGTGSSTLAAANKIVHGSAGLNTTKLITARKKLLAAQVDKSERLICVYTAEQMEDLMGDTQFENADYNTARALVQGEIDTWLGFKFVHCERLTSDGTSRLVPCFAESAICLGVWNDIETQITERADKSYATQVYVKGTFGGVRLEENKVVQIACNE